MKFRDFEITSEYASLGTRECDDDYKGKWEIVFANHRIFITRKDTYSQRKEFEYSSSAMDLSELLELKGECVYLYNDEYLYQSFGHSKRNRLGADNNRNLDRIKSIQELNAHVFNKKNKNLSDKDLLFAFRAIIQDALVVTECIDVWEFMEMHGYEDGRTAEIIFRACQDTYRKLNLSESEMYSILEELEEMEIY